jgi:hypothetical protein
MNLQANIKNEEETCSAGAEGANHFVANLSGKKDLIF